jgi:uncharacterized RDD family membrane protein YckC
MIHDPNVPAPLEPDPAHLARHATTNRSDEAFVSVGSVGPTFPIRTAPLWRRTIATLIDLIVPLALWGFATWLIVTSDPEPPPVAPWNFIDQVVDYLHDRPGRVWASGLVFLLLQVLWPVAFAGRTPGRRALGLTFVGPNGAPPTFGRLLGWSFLRLPSMLLAGIGAWWAILDPERRTLHDRAAGLWLAFRNRCAP